MSHSEWMRELNRRDLQDQLRSAIRRIRQKQYDKEKILSELSTDIQPKLQRIGKGHYGKIYSLHWGADSQYKYSLLHKMVN